MLRGSTWKRYYQMLDGIELAGYYIDFATDEYAEISNDEDEHFKIYIEQTDNTLRISRAEAA